jgi:itaconate CoA-transferase
MAAPLAGLTIIALEQAVAAPFCTSRLAEAGARVIKIERAEGDFARTYDDVVAGESSYFVWLNRGKESIALDIKDPDDAALLESMIASADVLVQNLSPGATTRAGFGSRDMRKRYPRLITCDISGYGEEGEWARMKAYDFLIQCETGLASITGGASEPARVGISIADIACGASAHADILQALYDRERTGRGNGVAISLFDCLADWMTVPLLHWDYGGKAPGRVGLRHPGIAPYGAFRTGDGKDVVVAVQNEREWRNFCDRGIQRPEIADDPRFCSNIQRVENRAALDGVIETVFATLSAVEIAERMATANVAYASFNKVEDFARHPQLRRIEIQSPSGPVRMPAPPWRWQDETSDGPGPSPGVNEQGAALRLEFARQVKAPAAALSAVMP